MSKAVAMLGRQFATTSVRCPHPGCGWTTDVHTAIEDIAPQLVEAVAGKLVFTVFRDLVEHMRYTHEKHVEECPGDDACTCAAHQTDLPDGDQGGRIVAAYHERRQARRAAAIQAELDGKIFADKVANAVRSVIEPEVHYDPRRDPRQHRLRLRPNRPSLTRHRKAGRPMLTPRTGMDRNDTRRK